MDLSMAERAGIHIMRPCARRLNRYIISEILGPLAWGSSSIPSSC